MFRYGEITAKNNLKEEVLVPEKFIKGTGDFFEVTAKKNSSWISIELPNHCLHNITGLKSSQNRNQLLDLEQFISKEILDRLYIELENQNEIKVITDILDENLSPFYSNWNKKLVSTPIVSYIYKNKGMINIQDLNDKFALSDRTLERLFSKEVGASPYRFISLVRFYHIIRELELKKDCSLTELIEQYNYFDHSHFEKDFKKFLGQKISEYKNIYNPLLTNGLARKFVK